jgi:two-component system cell cycle response regulator
MSSPENITKKLIPAAAVGVTAVRAAKHYVGIKKELSAVKQRNEKLEKLASRDSLTGLKNRGAFRDDLRNQISFMGREGLKGSLIMLDIDRFKSINDTHGHPGGDRVLVSMGKLLKSTVRPYDMVYRMGGEEFAAILPGTDEEGATTFAERLREMVEVSDFGIGQEVTASFGVGTIRPNVAATYSLADRALYSAKENGRNQVVAASSLLHIVQPPQT